MTDRRHRRTPRLLAATLGTLLAQSAPAAAPPDTIELNGVVRDFQRAHPDFNVVPIGGPGHYAGNVNLTLGVGQRPTFAGTGFKVDSQWRNAGSQPIAPHLFVDAGVPGEVKVANPPDVSGNATEDTWDSSLGPYDDQTPGPPPTYNVGAPMPNITAPTGMGPSVGNVTLEDTTVSSDLHCDDLDIDGLVQISGNRVIYCEGDVTQNTHSDLELLPGATLQLYATGSIVLSQPHTNFNANTGMPGLVTIYNLGTEVMRVGQPHSSVYATVIAPWAEMRVMPNSDFYGNFTGMDLDVQPNAGLHIDKNVTIVLDACGVPFNDTAGAAGLASDAGITSETTFAQWYKEILGVNMASGHAITLLNNGMGVYEYLDDAFYPIDAQLFGNEGDSHNNYFTYAIEAQFVYEACSGQFIEFAGADDAWVFVDDALAIDLGGVSPGTGQVVELDRLFLDDGQQYTLRLFYAQRDQNGASFNLRTNVDLWCDETVVTASIRCD